MNTTTIKIKGLTPLIMHSGRLADPLDKATRALAKLTGKRNKTEDDHLAIRKCEWYGGLYVNSDEVPCLPGEVLEACLYEGARQLKLGKVAKGGIIISGDYPLEYDGPKNITKLWENGGYLKVAGARVGKNRVIRSRPIFPKWAVEFEVLWDPSLVKDEDQVLDIVRAAAKTGVGDWRPKFGRFELVED